MIPKSFGLVARPPQSGLPFPDYQSSFLQDRVEAVKIQRETSFYNIRRLQDKLSDILDIYDFREAINTARQTASRLGACHLNTLNNKLERLCDSSPWRKYSNTENVKVISNDPLSKYQLEVLGLGLSFDLGPKDNSLIESMASINHFKYSNPDINISFLKGFIIPSFLNKNKQSLIPHRYHLALKELNNDNNLKIMRADKGGALVVMNTDEYVRKALLLLSDRNTYTELQHAPTIKSIQQKFNNQVRTLTRNIENPEQKNIVL